MTFSDNQLFAALQFASKAISLMKDDKGVHAETIIASVARMAGIFLFRSFGFDMIPNIKPGTAVFSEEANKKWGELFSVLRVALMMQNINADGFGAVKVDNNKNPIMLSFLETQNILDNDFNEIRLNHNLSEAEAAKSLAISTSYIIKQCENLIDFDLEIAFNIAAYGFMEGCKTMPAPIESKIEKIEIKKIKEENLTFETIELPTLIKNIKVQTANIFNEDGKETGFYFKREGKNIFLHKKAMDILQKHNMENETFAFLFDEIKTRKIFITDDTGIVFYIRDHVDETGERNFLWIHYHNYTENMNKELKDVFKNFPELGECYGVAECNDYIFVSTNQLSTNQKLINATAPIIRKYLPEGFSWKFLKFEEGTIIVDSIKRNDYEKLSL